MNEQIWQNFYTSSSDPMQTLFYTSFLSLHSFPPIITNKFRHLSLQPCILSVNEKFYVISISRQQIKPNSLSKEAFSNILWSGNYRQLTKFILKLSKYIKQCNQDFRIKNLHEPDWNTHKNQTHTYNILLFLRKCMTNISTMWQMVA